LIGWEVSKNSDMHAFPEEAWEVAAEDDGCHPARASPVKKDRRSKK
jgi:hypothetical protein